MWGCSSLWNSTIINHCLQEALSYRCSPLWWVIPTETGWPTWSSAVSLVDRSYAPGVQQKDLLFKPEPGQFVLWLSRHWSASNPYEICSAVGHQITQWSWEHAHSAGWGGDGGPLWDMCLTPDFSKHERWQCCGRCQFFQMEKNAPSWISCFFCGGPFIKCWCFL